MFSFSWSNIITAAAMSVSTVAMIFCMGYAVGTDISNGRSKPHIINLENNKIVLEEEVHKLRSTISGLENAMSAVNRNSELQIINLENSKNALEKEMRRLENKITDLESAMQPVTKFEEDYQKEFGDDIIDTLEREFSTAKGIAGRHPSVPMRKSS